MEKLNEAGGASGSAGDVAEAGPGGPRHFERIKSALAAAVAFATGFPVAALRFFIGRDVFFSYAHTDGEAYVQALANAVVERRPGISFYLDKYAAPPTLELPTSLVRHLGWSRMLVLVCTKTAATSVFVQKELTLFMASPRPLVPISLNDGAGNIDATVEPWNRISGDRWVADTIQKESSPQPSEAVVDRIVESIKFADHQTRITRILIAGGIAVAAALIAAGVAWNRIQKANAAEQARVNAVAQEKVAVQARKDAEEARYTAEQERTTAIQERDTAQMERDTAEKERAEAAAEAVRETRKASALAVANQAELLRAQPDQFETSALLAAAAVDQLSRLGVPSIEAYRTLADALDTLPLLTFEAEIVGVHLPDEVTISPDGRYVAAHAGEAFTLREVATGKVLPLRLPGTARQIHFSPDGKYLVLGIANRVEIWTTVDWQPLTDSRLAAWTEFPDVLARLEFGGDGRYLICGDEAGETRVVRVSDWTKVWSRDLDRRLSHAAISRDGRFFATMTWSQGSNVDVWDLQNASALAKPVRSLRDREVVLDLSVTDKDLTVIIERTQDFWTRDLSGWALTGEEGPLWTKVLKAGRVRGSDALLTNTIDQTAFDPLGTFVVYVSNQARYLAVTRLTDREELWRARLSDEVFEIFISPNGQWILVAGNDGLNRVWDARSGREVARMRHEGRLLEASFSSTGDALCAADERRRLRCWIIGGAVEQDRLEHDKAVRAVAFTDAGMETFSYDYEAGLYHNASEGSPDFRRDTWSLDRIQISSASHQDSYGVRAIAYRADGSQVLVAIDHEYEARLFRRGEASPVAKFVLDDEVNVVAMSRDGETTAVAANDGEIGVWRVDGRGSWRNAARWAVVADYDSRGGPPIPHAEVTAMALDDQGKQLAVGGSDGSVQVWSCCEGSAQRPRVRLGFGSEARAMAFSPVAPTTLAMLLDDGSLHVVDLLTRKPLLTATFQPPPPLRYPAIADESRRIGFSPDGRYVVTGGYDGYVRVWDLVVKTEVARLRHDAWVDAVTFDRSGDQVASGSYDGTARIWRWRPGALIRETCRRVGATARQELAGRLNSRSMALPCR